MRNYILTYLNLVCVVFLSVCIIIVGCEEEDVSPLIKVDLPKVEEPGNSGKGRIILNGMVDTFPKDYQQTEYFISGTAHTYKSDNRFGTDGKWKITPDTEAEYKTRIVVYRPVDTEKFNGTLIVEWFNVSSGVDAPVEWIAAHTEFIRKGYAYLGVSAQKVGVEGSADDAPGKGKGPNRSLKDADPARYQDLHHPGDSYSWDIFSQVLRLVDEPHASDVLSGLGVERVIVCGGSQSAGMLTTYYNAVEPVTRLADAFLIHSRSGFTTPLTFSIGGFLNAPANAHLRTDLDIPVIMVQSETDVVDLGYAAARQEDTEYVRLWEVAGTAHGDSYRTVIGFTDHGDDPAVADVMLTKSTGEPNITCDQYINSGPLHFTVKAAFRTLDQWVRTSKAAPKAERLRLNAELTALIEDHLGIAKGGIRTSYVDVPVARLSGMGGKGSTICGMLGTTTPFDKETLNELYQDHAAYVSAVKAATDSAVEKGFILPEDAALIKAAAEASNIGR